MDVPSMPPSSGNGADPPGIHERVEEIENRMPELAALRRDLDRTYRVVLELQVEIRNNHRTVLDKLEKLAKAP